MFQHFGNVPPKDSPGTLRLEQGMVVVGLGDMQLTLQKYPVVLSSCSSCGQMLEHIIRVAFIDWEYRAAHSQKPPKAPAALQGTAAGSYLLPLLNKPGLLWLLEGLSPASRSQLI